MRRRLLLASLIPLLLIPAQAAAAPCPDVLDLGTVIDAKPLNGAASTLTVTVGPTEYATGDSSMRCQVGQYSLIVFDVYFDKGSKDGNISSTITGGATAATADRKLTSCTPSSGNCSLNLGGVATTASQLTTDVGWLQPVYTNHAMVIKAVFAHDNAPGATDKLTVKVWLVK